MDVLAKTKELLASLSDVTESGSKIARYKIEVANLDRKLGIALRRVGERAWQMHTEGRSDVHDDPDVRGCYEEVRRLRARMEVIRQDIERNRSRVAQEAGRAARIVREEGAAPRPRCARRWGEGRLPKPRLRKGRLPEEARAKETSDLQP